MNVAVDPVLDRVTRRVINDPLDVPDATTAKHRIDEFTQNLGNTAAIVGAPWLLKQAVRLVRRSRVVPSAAAIAATASTLAAIAVSVQHLRVLASLLVHRLRAAGHPVDPAFVRRVTLALYLDPSVGADAARPNRMAAAHLATNWATHAVPLLRARKTATRVHRAADAIEALDLDAALQRLALERQRERDEARAIDLRRALPSEEATAHLD
ncbi:MAG: hypothetical protein JWL83_332 [Actinomycetia bacterium]|nr:hypothetical protein [Actinomycetes bacterium]